jgi:hypothetical protein
MKPSPIAGAIGVVAMLAPFALLAQQSAPSATAVPGSTGTVTPPTVAPIRVCPYQNLTLRPGMRGDETKALQSILAQDPTLYPQGLTSGYYGTLTQEAVKRLQRTYGLPETGVVDEQTRQIIFPCMTILVLSPNGGETWRVGETQKISWSVEAPFPVLMNQQSTGAEGKPQPMTRAPGPSMPSTNVVRPFFQHLSLDLIRYDGPQILTYPAPVYYHIGSASLEERSFSWTIPSSITEGKMYKVRITLWRDVPNPYECKTQPCPLAPESNLYPPRWQGTVWDESDNYFSILGGGTASPLPTPGPDRGKLIELRAQLNQALESIQKAIQILNQLIGITPPTF